MKHLRLFESFISEGFSDPHYREIPKDEYYDVFDNSRKFVQMSDKRVKQLELFGFEVNPSYGKNVEMVKEYRGKDITVSEIEDEYFFVQEWDVDTWKSKYYRCDQFDGLKKLIEDKGWG